MANDYFKFKQFTIHQSRSAMKVTTDSCLFGAWCANEIYNEEKRNSSKGRVLDIGAGTALLSLMVAQKADVFIDAIEIESEAADEAGENINSSPFASRVKLIDADINDFPGQDFQYILSNPPFYENDLRSPNEERNIAHHSHQLKWSDLFPILRSKIASDGKIFLLLPYSRIQLADQLIEASELYINKEIIVYHREGRSPFRRMVQLSATSKLKVTEDLFIHNSNGEYSGLFTFYLQDYYLYL